MPVLPEEVLQKLICSCCKKYLSVFPIKVYPNKNVLCGRCEDRRGGTVSRLYELVAKQFKFACVNRFEGCKDVMPAPDVEKHEFTCYSGDYVCPVCSDFNGSAYDLLHHIKINHKTATLENKYFLIDLDQGSTSEVYFYCKNDFFVVSYQYDASLHQLTLFLGVFGKERLIQQNIMHKFLLYSVHNKLQYKTGNICSESGFVEKKVIEIDLTRHRYPRSIMICKFQVWNSAIMLEKYHHNKTHVEVQSDLPPILDKSVNKALLKFTFNEIRTMESKVGTYFSTHKYWVGNRAWRLLIETKQSTSNSTRKYLLVFLYQEKYGAEILPCKVVATITFISFIDTQYHKSAKLIIKNFKSNSEQLIFLTWDTVLLPKYGYIKNDSIEFHVLIEVLPPEVPRCEDCKKFCSTCK